MLLITTLFVSFVTTQAQWIQVGQDIDGEAAGDRSGQSISINSDGSIIAIGAPENDDNGYMAGHVRVYQNIDGSWSQMGTDIHTVGAYSEFGRSVSISSDGLNVAIGAPWHSIPYNMWIGLVHVFQYANGNWSQIGLTLEGQTAEDRFGWSVSLSLDGSVLAIGAPYNDGNEYNSGHVRIYKKNTNGFWTKIGSDIEGEAEEDLFGWSVSLSSDGSIVAIGAPHHYGNGYHSGHVHLYQNNNDIWTQIGTDIEAETPNDKFGTSVSLSSDGSIVAIGAPHNDENGNDSGHVRIFQNINEIWTQIGADIDGETAGDLSGWSVDLSSNGLIVAIGAIENDGNGNKSGHVRIYQNINGNWTQRGTDIDGESENDESGYSVSLSSNGSIVAIGAPLNDGNGSFPGHVRLYMNESIGLSELSKQGILIYPNPTNNTIYLKSIYSRNVRFFLYDVTGKLLFNKKLSTNNNQVQIDLSQFENGIYFLKIQLENNIISSKIVKE